MPAFSTIREGLQYTVAELIQKGHTYIVDIRGPREQYYKRDNCFQIVAQTMVYRDCALGLTVHLPFDPSTGLSEECLRFLESPLRSYFDKYVWAGIPCFALRLGENVEVAERVIRLLLVDVYEYNTATEIECQVSDEGPLESSARNSANRSNPHTGPSTGQERARRNGHFRAPCLPRSRRRDTRKSS